MFFFAQLISLHTHLQRKRFTYSLHHVKKSGLLFVKDHGTRPASFSQC